MIMTTIDTYLFDWGDTLMVDFPGVPGKMCDWERVEAVEGAREALETLYRSAELYIATAAAESSERDIWRAFARVGLDPYLAGVFCRANLGVHKGSPAFFQAIIDRLGVDAARTAVVGDSLEKDVLPALEAGLSAYWLTGAEHETVPQGAVVIYNLRDLCHPAA